MGRFQSLLMAAMEMLWFLVWRFPLPVEGRFIILDIEEEKHAQGNSLANTRCSITQKPSTLDTTIRPFPIEFYYTVESLNESIDYLPALENAIFSSISNILLLCYEGGPSTNMNSVGLISVEDNSLRSEDANKRDGGRKLTKQEQEQRELRTDNARRLGLISISPDPADEFAMNATCTPEEARNYCKVIHGKMTVLALGRDDASLFVDTMLQHIEWEMQGGHLLDVERYPAVQKVSFGDNGVHNRNAGVEANFVMESLDVTSEGSRRSLFGFF